MNFISGYIKDFSLLFFPEICHACGVSLVDGEKHFCTSCVFEFPYTNYHLDPENKLAKQFWGRVQIEAAATFLFFSKAGKVQNIMHQLKYNQQPQIGVELGRLYGNQLKNTAPFNLATGIIPVPLHADKLKKRGFNQSEQFALGLSESLAIPVYNHILIRVKSADSQTSKSRKNRFNNMREVFKATESDHSIESILLVDDTITTGATLEACIIALQEIGIKQISVVGIALAE